MNTTRTVMTALVTGTLLVGGGAYTAAQAAPWTDGATSVSVATADSTLVDALTFAREEERMARDLYQALADTYDGAAPFANIARSEQRHFDAVGTLLDRYGVPDPADGRKAGSYADASLQDRYDGWLADGKKSLDDAYDVGAALETRDIADLEDTVASLTQADARQVFGALLNASRHHLAAFEAAADGTLGDGTGFGPGNGMGDGMGPGYGMGDGRGNGPGHGMGMGRGAGNGNGPGHGFGPGDCPMLDDAS